MVDANPSATPIPTQPVVTVTSPEALTPLPAPPPHAVAPAVTDPVSSLDFPPVDDAFALEMRAETIEQLAGGDALRRGASERIEAGRSQTNADLVAGRDRVRVHATLHEHTGHGLAELAAHLHTTVDGALDVHAGMEDTVRLAGHMRDRWDGGAAIVAAMTDDTVGGGGIRVTTPLDLWVHGLMGAEERIGTCTADAVLMELGATHYEREYGPGVHAAGLAAYTGSLYQSNRSTFRALMRVSSGVRNLIAGRGGGGGGGNGGAGRAPAASPPPVPAQTGAASESATGTLAAGRRAAQAPATTFDIADALTGARRAPLEEFVDSIDARVAEEIGEPGTVVRAENLPELSRCADTAEQLGALQETLRIDGAASGSETARGMRASEAEGALSMHPAGGEGGALEIEPPSAVYGENAAMVRPHPGVPWGQGPEMKLGLLGGADRPPQSAAPGSDFPAVYRRMRELRSHYNRHSRSDIVYSFTLVTTNISRKVAHQFRRFGGNTEELAHRARGITTADQAYRTLQETARQAERDGDLTRAGTIHEALGAIDELAVEMLQAVLAKHGIAEPPSIQAMQRPPTAADPTVTVTAIPPPAHTPMQFDWITAFNQVRDFARRSLDIGFDLGHSDARAAADRISKSVMRRFRKFGGNPAHLLPPSGGSSATEQAYRTIEDMVRHAAESGSATRTCAIRQALEFIHQYATIELDKLTREYGALDALSIQATRTMQVTQAMQRLPATAGPLVTVASTTAALVGRLDVPGPAHRIVRRVDPPFPEPAAGLVQTTDVPGLPPASGLPGPPLSEAAGAEAGDLGRVRLDPPATVSGTTAAHPAIAESTVKPSLAGSSSFWLQPVDPAPAPGTVPFDPGLHHAGMAVQPPPVTTTARSTAPALSRGAAFPTPWWLDDDFPDERALLAANPGRADRQWLDHVQELPRLRDELAPPSADWTTGLAELDVTELDRLLRRGESVSHPAPPAPPPAPERTAAGAVAPGFARADSGAGDLPFLHRQRIAHRFRTDDALIEAEHAHRIGSTDALGWSPTRWPEVLHDLYRLNAFVQLDSAAAAARLDADWPAIEALVRILDAPSPSP